MATSEPPTTTTPATDPESQPLTTATETETEPLPSPILTTRNLIIRPMYPPDAPSMSYAANTASVAAYMTTSFPHPYTLSAAQTWISLNYPPPSPPAQLQNWVIVQAAIPEVVIGGLGFKPGVDVHSHTAEFGYWIGEPWWGKGYATEAVEALTRFGFEERGWKRLVATVVEGNGGSNRCLEKCGFRQEGLLKGHWEKNGVNRDFFMFGLVREDWVEWNEGRKRL